MRPFGQEKEGRISGREREDPVPGWFTHSLKGKLG